MRRVKICAISYINTTPFVYGIRHAGNDLCVDLLLHTPSQCVSKIENGECDIAIVPVASLLWLNNIEIISDFSISATGKVRTVELLSDTPLNDITDIYLDGDSRTSSLLVRILCEQYWNITPTFHHIKYADAQLSPNYGDGYLMIGDKVFESEHQFKYNHDLAAAWEKLTSLPFVFAVWIARKGIDKEIVRELNCALAYGTQHVKEAVKELVTTIDSDLATDYLTNYIEFSLNDDKRKAIELYLSKAAMLKSKEYSSPSPSEK